MQKEIRNNEDYLRQVTFLNNQSLKYYNDADPDIPDSEYDRLFRQLKDYETLHSDEVVNHSPTQRIGAPVMFRHKQPHKRQMQSLDNAFNEVEFSEFLDRCYELTQSTEMCSELKFDGLAISIEMAC
jgi:DNA ligase (NAD+)